MRTGKLPELLAPAGSMESLRAALAAGADAVYFGSTAFSNRMRAKNFENSTMADTLRLIHSCGAKAYVTVNTRVRDRETRELDELLASILGGPETCDAVICADFGAAARIRETYPDAVLHASTQTSLSCPADGEVLKSLGFTRLVVPRELSLSEIREIADKSPLEVEMFIHGAHCVSLSGQCLMSYFMGGRSGNRGECAQPCRLPYQKDGKSGYPISLADMCLAGRITDVIASGAASLKIEGRLKSAPYVYGVTKIYRTLLDEGRNASKKEIDALAALFTRGFTDGFFTGAYSAMSGGKGEESNKQTFADEIRTRLGQRIDRVSRERRTSSDGKLPLKASFVMTENAPVTLTLTCGKLTASVSGTEPQPASGAPASPDSVGKNLVKMGGTSYTLAMEDIDFSIGDGLFLPVSEINRLRRDAVLQLDEMTAASSDGEKQKITLPRRPIAKPQSTAKTAEFALSDILTKKNPALTDSLNRYFDRIYVPHTDLPAVLAESGLHPEKLCAVMPVITPSDEQIHAVLDSLKDLPSHRVLCHTVGQAKLAQAHGFTADLSFRANVWNRDAMEICRALTNGTVTLSPELNPSALRDLMGEVIVYGRIPAMTMGRCVICGGKCPKGNRGGRAVYPDKPKSHRCMSALTDRKNETFPVIGQADCTNIIYNSVPTWMGDRMHEIKNAEAVRFLFTVETAEEILSVIDGYENARPGTGRRI